MERRDVSATGQPLLWLFSSSASAWRQVVSYRLHYPPPLSSSSSLQNLLRLPRSFARRGSRRTHLWHLRPVSSAPPTPHPLKLHSEKNAVKPCTNHVPGSSISSGMPRRCHVGSTSSLRPSRNRPFVASSHLIASRTTCSFSMACTLHVEYAIRCTDGTVATCGSARKNLR